MKVEACIRGSVSRIGGIGAEAQRMGGIGCVAVRSGGMWCAAERLGGMLCEAVRSGGIYAYASLVCAVNDSVYLRVRPVETQWVTVDTSREYNVESNTNWLIE